MPRYIDANLIRYKDIPFSANDEVGVYVGYGSKSQIDAIPTADVAEVKHGKWIGSIDFPIMQAMIRCSLCNEPAITMSKFCPNCGAKMDLEEKSK